jgi:hypothetical protein
MQRISPSIHILGKTLLLQAREEVRFQDRLCRQDRTRPIGDDLRDLVGELHRIVSETPAVSAPLEHGTHRHAERRLHPVNRRETLETAMLELRLKGFEHCAV